MGAYSKPPVAAQTGASRKRHLRGTAECIFTDTNTGWAVGDAGTILSTIDGGGPMQLLPRTLPTPPARTSSLALNVPLLPTLTPERWTLSTTTPTDPFTWSVSQENFNCSDIYGAGGNLHFR